MEIIFFESIFFLAAWYFQFLIPHGYGWYSKSIMILLGIIAIILHGKPYEYGLIPHNIKFNLKWILRIILLFSSTLIIFIIASFIMGEFKFTDLRVMLIDLIWFFIFVGFAEELFFRGYVQSRLNEVFTRKYEKILWVKFNWTQGTLVAGIFFFGLPHILVAVNPFMGRISLSPIIIMISLFACFIGVILGVIRERVGDIILPTVIHGLIDFVNFSFSKMIGFMLSSIATSLALFLFFLFFFEKLLTEIQ